MHFDFDDYEADLTIKESGQTFILWRMVPPGAHKYFTSIQLFRTSFIYNQIYMESCENFVIILS